MTISFGIFLLGLLAAFVAGGAVALVPIKYVLGPELKGLTEAARGEARQAKTWAAQAVREVSSLTETLERKHVLAAADVVAIRRT